MTIGGVTVDQFNDPSVQLAFRESVAATVDATASEVCTHALCVALGVLRRRSIIEQPPPLLHADITNPCGHAYALHAQIVILDVSSTTRRRLFRRGQSHANLHGSSRRLAGGVNVKFGITKSVSVDALSSPSFVTTFENKSNLSGITVTVTHVEGDTIGTPHVHVPTKHCALSCRACDLGGALSNFFHLLCCAQVTLG